MEVAGYRVDGKTFAATSLAVGAAATGTLHFALGLSWAVSTTAAAIPALALAGNVAARRAPVIQPGTRVPVECAAFPSNQFNCYYINDKRLPLVVEAIDESEQTAEFLHHWAKTHREEVRNALRQFGAIYFSGFNIDYRENYEGDADRPLVTQMVADALGEPRDKQIDTGGRTWVRPGLFTATDAPAWVRIYLHNENSYQPNHPEYICLLCDEPPEPGSGETLLGWTRDATDEVKAEGLWEIFKDEHLKLINRFPSEKTWFGWLISRLNPSHSTWQALYETEDKDVAAKKARESGVEVRWNGEWLETIRIAPATIKSPYDDKEEYFFNQVQGYDHNPIIRGGYFNHWGANLIYCWPGTRQHDMCFYDQQTKEETPVPKGAIYKLYDIYNRTAVRPPWQKKGDMIWANNYVAQHGRAPFFGPRRVLTLLVDGLV